MTAIIKNLVVRVGPIPMVTGVIIVKSSEKFQLESGLKTTFTFYIIVYRIVLRLMSCLKLRFPAVPVERCKSLKQWRRQSIKTKLLNASWTTRWVDLSFSSSVSSLFLPLLFISQFLSVFLSQFLSVFLSQLFSLSSLSLSPSRCLLSLCLQDLHNH